MGVLNAACVGTKPTTHNVYGTCIGVADVIALALGRVVVETIGDRLRRVLLGRTSTVLGRLRGNLDPIADD